jgi:hypothetical protein
MMDFLTNLRWYGTCKIGIMMKRFFRNKGFLLFLLACILLSGCQVFPYVYTPTVKPTDVTVQNPTPDSSVTTTPPSNPNENGPPPAPTQTETASIEPPITLTPTRELLDESKFHWFFPMVEKAKQYAFAIQEGTPLYTKNFTHPQAGCEWLGVAGQVFNEEGQEISKMVVVVGGYIEEEYVEFATLSGMAPLYGPGGYEIIINSAPFDSQEEFWIEIFDLDGQASSEKVFFDTFAGCEKNLILINFVRNTAVAQPKNVNPEPTPSPIVQPYP